MVEINLNLWMSGVFEHPLENARGTVGGDTQIVYFGQVSRTYQFACQDEYTGLWVVADGDEAHATPVPTLHKGGIVEKSGKNIKIRLRAEGNQYISKTGYWIDNPMHSNFSDFRTPGVLTYDLDANATQVVYQSDTTSRIFRFGGTAFRTGVWVATENGEFPVPTLPTTIDIGAKSLTIVSKNDEGRRIKALDITN